MGACFGKEAPSSSLVRGSFNGASKGGGNDGKTYKRETWTGICRIEIIEAHMKRKDRWFAVVSLGTQTFKTGTSDTTSDPEWKQEKKVALEDNGPRVARISIFEFNTYGKNKVEGYCEVDLTGVFNEGESNRHIRESLDIYNVATRTETMGTILISYTAEPKEVTEKDFARRILSIVDYDENGELSLDEFRDLMEAFGNQFKPEEVNDLFGTADENNDGIVSTDELASLLALKRTMLMNRCPVCGEMLGKNEDTPNDVIHLALCFDEGTGNTQMTGGFLTDKQAAYGWMFKLSEWIQYTSYDVGLREGKNAQHILVWDREDKRLVEELIDSKMVLAMRAIYQSRLGQGLLDAGTRKLLQQMSESQGERMSKPDSIKLIPRFIENYKENLDLDENKYPITHYKTFNEFFVRELKDGARPIAEASNQAVAVSAADCRLMVCNSVDDAKRFWVKGRKFSLAGLLGSEALGKEFDGGSLAFFRLAPQDYHRFHSPVSATIGSITPIPGHLFTVNPIAVNSKYCNVFTENKREVARLHTKDFGDVMFVAIGATMVGSIIFTKEEGATIQKGEELGYFQFGGSTCIVVFKEKAIDFDEDLLVNSEKHLETLVKVGMTLGVARAAGPVLRRRPTIKDSVVAFDNVVAQTGTVFVANVANRPFYHQNSSDAMSPPFSPPREAGTLAPREAGPEALGLPGMPGKGPMESVQEEAGGALEKEAGVPVHEALTTKEASKAVQEEAGAAAKERRVAVQEGVGAAVKEAAVVPGESRNKEAAVQSSSQAETMSGPAMNSVEKGATTTTPASSTSAGREAGAGLGGQEETEGASVGPATGGSELLPEGTVELLLPPRSVHAGGVEVAAGGQGAQSAVAGGTRAGVERLEHETGSGGA